MLKGVRITSSLLKNNSSVAWKLSKRSAGVLALDGPPEYYNHVLTDLDNVAPLDNTVELTPEKRAQLAAKWNLRPEDYVPMNDYEFNIGDYPKIPYESIKHRDPHYDWDDPQLRRNWGEPMLYNWDNRQFIQGDTTPTVIDHPTRMNRMYFWYTVWAAIFYISYYYQPWFFPMEVERYTKERRPSHHIKDGTAISLFEKRGVNPKMLEVERATHYTFNSKYKWDPTKYISH